MTAAVNSIIYFFNLSWLTGPIFDKELRVASRRRRNYIIRFFYIAILTIILAIVWYEEVRYRGSYNVAYRISRMSKAGIILSILIVWFQFVASQIIAGVMLSTSISDEIYHKTLGTLMTTPISSFQLVMGKILSKLLQITLLVGISFPLLSIVRVFGGIPWGYVISSLAITMITVIFVGSVSLFYSIFTRKAYVSIILTILTLAAVFLLIPLLVAIFYEIFDIRINDRTFFSVLSHINPYITMMLSTAMLDNPSGLRGYYFNWPVACLSMVLASALLVLTSVLCVRKAALHQATGQPDIFAPKVKRREKVLSAGQLESSIRRICIPPVLWKELCGPVFGKRKILFSIFITLSILILIFTYIFCAYENVLDDQETHMFYVTLFFSIGFLFTVILPATTITQEKESRSWHLLLATTLSSGQIAFGKFIGSIKRCLPAWGYLLGHMIFFMAAGFLHPLGLLHMIIITAGTCIFLIGTGLFFSTFFKRTTTAVIMNFTFAAVIWGGIPLTMAVINEIVRGIKWHDLVETYCNAIPFVQVVVSMDSTANGLLNLKEAYWPTGTLGPFESTVTILFFAMINMSAGLFFTWLAKTRFRKKIF